MKGKHFAIAMIILSCLAGTAWAKGGNGDGGGSAAVLSDSEAEHIIFLRQEEKLARDVYVALYSTYGKKIFLNISASEQNHMDSVEGLIVKYNLEDPAGDDSSCVFSDTSFDFTALCNELITAGQGSLEDALKVGVFIEEMDIHDIEEVMLPDVAQTDVRRVLTNLLAGSYNHLDAFEKSLGLP